MPYIAKSYHENQLVLDPKELKLRAKRESAVARCNKPMAVGRHTTHGTPPIGRPDYGPGEELGTPSKKLLSLTRSTVLVGGGVRQRRSCALGWYRPSVGVPGT